LFGTMPEAIEHARLHVRRWQEAGVAVGNAAGLTHGAAET